VTLAENVLATHPDNARAQQLLAEARRKLETPDEGTEPPDVVDEVAKSAAERAREEMLRAKEGARTAGALEHARAAYQKGEGLEGDAESSYKDGRFEPSSGKFREARDLYAQAETQALEAKETALSTDRQTALDARAAFDRLRAEAVAAGAQARAAGPFTQGERAATQASRSFDAGNYPAATVSYNEALQSMTAARDLARRELGQATARMEQSKKAMLAVKERAGNDAAGRTEESRGDQLAASGDLDGAASAYGRAAELYALAAERVAVLRVIQEYEAAYEARDFAAVRRVFPAASSDLQRAFANLRSISIEMTPLSAPAIEGETATVEYQIAQSVVQRVGGQRGERSYTSAFRLTKSGGVWVISEDQQRGSRN
jgi:hypothetical protein